MLPARLFRLTGLRRAIRRGAPMVMWTEGEKDAGAAGDLIAAAGGGWYVDPLRKYVANGPTTSHPFGAGKATPAQAAHFDGYRGRVLIAVNDDDAGVACGLLRYELLRGAGLLERQLHIVRAADAIGGGLGNGADIADHVGAGYGLRELVRVDAAPRGYVRPPWFHADRLGGPGAARHPVSGSGSPTRTRTTIEQVRRYSNPELRIAGIIANAVEQQSRRQRHWLSELANAAPAPLWEPVIRKATWIAEALESGVGLDEWGTPAATVTSETYDGYLTELFASARGSAR